MREERLNIYEGRITTLFQSNCDNELIQHFKNYSSPEIGIINSTISAHLMEKINKIGIKTNFIKKINMNEHLVTSLHMFPFSLTLHNSPNKNMSSVLSIPENENFHNPLCEYIYTNNNDTLYLSEQSIINLGWAHVGQIEEIKEQSSRINFFLRGYLDAYDIKLIKIKMFFGVNEANEVLLCGHLTPNNIDIKTDVDILVNIPNKYHQTKKHYTFGKILGVIP